MTVMSDVAETTPGDAGAPILVVEDLRTHFAVPAGSVKAVDGVSFELGRGRTLGVVGESGSGKTVLSRSIMGLNVASNATTTGSVVYDGQQLVGRTPKQMKRLWGADMAMVFQDPMTTLNPVVKVGRQLTEHMREHLGLSKADARERAIELALKDLQGAFLLPALAQVGVLALVHDLARLDAAAPLDQLAVESGLLEISQPVGEELRLVDRHRARAVLALRHVAAVQRDRIGFEVGGSAHAGLRGQVIALKSKGRSTILPTLPATLTWS